MCANSPEGAIGARHPLARVAARGTRRVGGLLMGVVGGQSLPANNVHNVLAFRLLHLISYTHRRFSPFRCCPVCPLPVALNAEALVTTATGLVACNSN
jgi:hypothetical protein